MRRRPPTVAALVLGFIFPIASLSLVKFSLIVESRTRSSAVEPSRRNVLSPLAEGARVATPEDVGAIGPLNAGPETDAAAGLANTAATDPDLLTGALPNGAIAAPNGAVVGGVFPFFDVNVSK